MDFNGTGWLIVAGRAISDVIVPPVCLSCHQPMTEHDCLCAACWTGVDFISQPLCDRLGLPLAFATAIETDEGRFVSAAALDSPPAYDRARAVAAYAGTMQKLIHGFKYSDRHDGRRLFGRWLAAAGSQLTADADLIVPVPLNRWRLLSRRYNQAALLALEVGKTARKPVRPLVLQRIKATRSQVGLSSAERALNVADAFAVPPRQRGVIEGRRVLLIDDVLTTGATANAAAKTLKGAGARSVDVLALGLVTEL